MITIGLPNGQGVSPLMDIKDNMIVKNEKSNLIGGGGIILLSS